MDIQHLVDRLEDLVDEGRHMPLSKYTMIDEERALEIIDQMRISIPEEIEKAARVLAQRDRVLAQANEEAARIIQQAHNRSEQLVDREAMVQAAQGRASNIIEQARQEADVIMAEADKYVYDVLTKLEQQLGRATREVRNGLNELDNEDVPTAPAAVKSASAVQPAPQAASQAAPTPVQFPPLRQPVEVSAKSSEDGKK
jgi:vacuolar-type H+-ATPase subunit H